MTLPPLLKRITALTLGALVTAHPALAGQPSQPGPTWDGLVEVHAKRVDVAYLAPGADFRPYRRLIVDPTEVAFRRDWLRDVNETRDLSRQVRPEDAQEMLAAARTNFADVFGQEFRKAGYEIVTQPGPDVLRVSPAVMDLYVNAPEQLTAGRSRTYTANAGEATLVLELRDSQTHALLGRVLDRRQTRDSMTMQRATQVSNVADFRALFRSWAGICLSGLETLKQVSPIPENVEPGQELD